VTGSERISFYTCAKSADHAACVNEEIGKAIVHLQKEKN